MDDAHNIRDTREFETNIFPGPVEAIREFCDKSDRPLPLRACLAVAAPVIGDRVDFTNNYWCFSVSATKQALGLTELLVINDAVAWALTLTSISSDHQSQIGGHNAPGRGTRGYLIPGSGLGISGLVPIGETWLPVAGEGGYVELVGGDAYESEVLAVIRAHYGRVSAERVLSGPGLVELYSAISRIEGRIKPAPNSESITRDAACGRCRIATKTVSIYVALLGEVAATVALILGATGGIFIAGNISRSLSNAISAGKFRERFDSSGRAKDYLQCIPTFLVTNDGNSLRGCSRAMHIRSGAAGLVRA